VFNAFHFAIKVGARFIDIAKGAVPALPLGELGRCAKGGKKDQKHKTV